MESISQSLAIKEIGARIRFEREKFGLTREKIAEIIGLSPFFIGQIERGERNMSLDTLYKISDVLNVSLDYLLKGYDLYMENIVVDELLEDNYKNEIDQDIQEILSLLSGSSKQNIKLIKEISQLILPLLNK